MLVQTPSFALLVRAVVAHRTGLLLRLEALPAPDLSLDDWNWIRSFADSPEETRRQLLDEEKQLSVTLRTDSGDETFRPHTGHASKYCSWEVWTRLPVEEAASVSVTWFALPRAKTSFRLPEGVLDGAGKSARLWP